MKSDLARSKIVYERMLEDYSKQVVVAYRDSLREIQAELADFYRKYADRTGQMSMAEVSKYNRLRNLEKGIAGEINTLTGKQIRTTDRGLSNIYQESFYRTGFAIDNQIRREFQTFLEFGALPKEQVVAAVKNPIENITQWPERARDNTAAFRKRINNAITRGIIQGQSYPQMANEVKDYYDKEAWRADRIMRTEGHRVRCQGQQNSYEQAEAEGVELEKEWLAAMDTEVRDEHGNADGQRRDVDEPFNVGGEDLMYPGDPAGSGWNVINCRCDSEPIVEGMKAQERRVRLTDEEYERRLAEADGDKSKVSHSEVVPYQNYNQWAEDKGIGKFYKGPEPRV